MQGVMIFSNGSKWYGEAPDSVETLLNVLARETLDPTFEDYGNFINRDEATDDVQAWGNFLTVSHVFDIRGSYEAMRPLIQAIQDAQQRPEYLKARRDLRRRKTSRLRKAS